MSFRHILTLFCLLLMFSSGSLKPDLLHKKQQKTIPQVSTNSLINAYFTGRKNELPKKVKSVHKTLNLQHLMTPSGLHLASLLFVLSLVVKSPRIIFFALILLGVILFPFSGLDSLKRMILFGVLRKNPLLPFSLKGSFLATFLLCFASGQYFSNPLSFCLSFVFIGALIYSPNKFLTFIFLLIIQALLSHWLIMRLIHLVPYSDYFFLF